MSAIVSCEPEGVVVDADDDGRVELVLGRGGEDHPLGAGVDVLLERRLVREPAGRLEGDLDLQVLPGEGGRVLLGEGLDGLVADGDVVLAVSHLSVQATQDRVVLQQVGQSRVVGEVVHRHDLDVCARGLDGSEEVAADAAKAIDTNADGHFRTLPFPRNRVLTRPKGARSFNTSTL